MTTRKARPTLADYAVQALSPALIIAMVASLLFFLLEILYQGRYSSNVRWTLFFFVIGAVLVARISMRADIAERSSLYGAVLGLVTWIATLRYSISATGQWDWLINLLLIGLIWWCAHRLTWDCTYLEEQTGADGKGVLEAAGITTPAVPEEEEKGEGTKPLTWWQRYEKYREERRKRRAPGVWVVYFSLAALPLFGLGQALLPAGAEEKRGEVFRHLIVYVGCGLGLLMTTAFLGVRNYLRQRRIRMPGRIAATWLSTGSVIIVLLLAGAAVLPRPSGEGWLSSEKGKVASSEGDEKDGGDEEEGDKKPDEEGEKDKGEKGEEGEGGKGDDGGNGEGEGDGKGEEGDRKKPENDPEEKTSSSSSAWEKASSILKWVVFAIVALVTLILVGRHFLRFLAHFSDWAKNLLEAFRRFWESLWGRGEEAQAEGEAEVREKTERAVPFSAFSNPFEDGRAGSMSMRELACYTFAAFEAWARERHLPRDPGRTPFEHVEMVAEDYPELARDLRRMAMVHGKVVYGNGRTGKTAREALEVVWRKLSASEAQPVAV